MVLPFNNRKKEGKKQRNKERESSIFENRI